MIQPLTKWNGEVFNETISAAKELKTFWNGNVPISKNLQTLALRIAKLFLAVLFDIFGAVPQIIKNIVKLRETKTRAIEALRKEDILAREVQEAEKAEAQAKAEALQTAAQAKAEALQAAAQAKAEGRQRFKNIAKNVLQVGCIAFAAAAFEVAVGAVGYIFGKVTCQV